MIPRHWNLTNDQQTVIQKKGKGKKHLFPTKTGKKKNVIHAQEFLRVSTHCRYMTPTIERFSMGEFARGVDTVGEKFLSSIIKANILMILGEDLVTGEQQYFICKEYATSGSKEACILEMKKFDGQRVEVSCPVMEDAFKNMCWGKVIFNLIENLKNSLEHAEEERILQQEAEPARLEVDATQAATSLADEPAAETPIVAASVAVETTAAGSKEFLRITKQLSKTPDEKVTKAHRSKNFLCCSGR